MAKILQPEIIVPTSVKAKPQIQIKVKEEEILKSAGKPTLDKSNFTIFFESNIRLRARTPRNCSSKHEI